MDGNSEYENSTELRKIIREVRWDLTDSNSMEGKMVGFHKSEQNLNLGTSFCKSLNIITPQTMERLSNS